MKRKIISVVISVSCAIFSFSSFNINTTAEIADDDIVTQKVASYDAIIGVETCEEISFPSVMNSNNITCGQLGLRYAGYPVYVGTDLSTYVGGAYTIL